MKFNSDSLLTAIRKNRIPYTLAALVFFSLGVLLVCAPVVSQRLMGILTGAGILAYGAFQSISFFLDRNERGFSLRLFAGVITFSLGVLFLFHQELLIRFLMTVLSLMILITGTVSIRRALKLRACGYAKWKLSLAFPSVCMLSALIFAFFPALQSPARTTITGLTLVVQAVTDLISIQTLFSITKE